MSSAPNSKPANNGGNDDAKLGRAIDFAVN
jgi:hypothetical protein